MTVWLDLPLFYNCCGFEHYNTAQLNKFQDAMPSRPGPTTQHTTNSAWSLCLSAEPWFHAIRAAPFLKTNESGIHKHCAFRLDLSSNGQPSGLDALNITSSRITPSYYVAPFFDALPWMALPIHLRLCHPSSAKPYTISQHTEITYQSARVGNQSSWTIQVPCGIKDLPK